MNTDPKTGAPSYVPPTPWPPKEHTWRDYRPKVALTSCPACNTTVSTDAIVCPKCGHPFKATAQRMSGGSMFWLIVGAILVAVVIMRAC